MLPESTTTQQLKIEPEPIHAWFSLSRSSYLVLPRSLMQAAPLWWQQEFVALLDQLRGGVAHLEVEDDYCVQLRGDNGRFIEDPFAQYRHVRHDVRMPSEKPDATSCHAGDGETRCRTFD